MEQLPQVLNNILRKTGGPIHGRTASILSTITIATSHEVLGIYSGNATLHLGGENGGKFKLKAGDVIVIPAGVGHKCLESSDDFGVVGAYPDGRDWDLLKGEPAERIQANKNIAALPLPAMDPYLGKRGGLVEIWKAG